MIVVTYLGTFMKLERNSSRLFKESREVEWCFGRVFCPATEELFRNVEGFEEISVAFGEL